MNSEGPEALKGAIRRSVPLIVALIVLGIVAVNVFEQTRGGRRYEAEARVLINTTQPSSIRTGTQRASVHRQSIRQRAALRVAAAPRVYALAARRSGGELGRAATLHAATGVAPSVPLGSAPPETLGPHGTPVLDTFDRPDEGPPLGSPWKAPTGNEVAGFAVSNKKAIIPTAHAVDGQGMTLPGVSANTGAAVFLQLPDGLNTVHGHFYLDLQNTAPGANNGFELTIDTNESPMSWRLYSLPSGDGYGDLTHTQNVSAGDWVALSYNRSTLTAWYRPAAGGAWSAVVRRDPTDDPAGANADVYIDPTESIDNWGGGVIESNGGDVITFTASSSKPETAAGIVNAVASAYVAIQGKLPGGAKLVQRATSGPSQTSSSVVKHSVLGFALGLIAALLVIAVREAIETIFRRMRWHGLSSGEQGADRTAIGAPRSVSGKTPYSYSRDG